MTGGVPPFGGNGAAPPSGRVEALDRLIDGYLGGSMPFEAFAAGYAGSFITLPDAAFPSVEAEVWYGVLHERIEWTAPAPPPETRELGWMSVDDFRGWLGAYMQSRPG